MDNQNNLNSTEPEPIQTPYQPSTMAPQMPIEQPPVAQSPFIAPAPEAPKKSKKKLIIIAIIVALLLIGSGLYYFLVGVSNPGGSSNNQTSNTGSDVVKMDESKYENSFSGFQISVPEGWGYAWSGLANAYSDPKDDDNKTYNLIVDGYISNPSQPFVGKLVDIPKFMEGQLRGAVSNFCRSNNGFEQTINNSKTIKINGREIYKVDGTITGKLGDSQTSFKYIAYYTLFSNESKGTKDVPIYLLITINSDDQTKIDYADTILSEMMKTIKAFD